MSELYAWLRRHPRLVDGVLAAALALGGGASAGGSAVPHQRIAILLISLGLTVPVIFRRRHPIEAFSAAIGIGALQVALGLRPMPVAADLSIVVLLYTLAAYTTRRASVVGLAVCLSGSAVEAVRLHLTTITTVTVGNVPHPHEPTVATLGRLITVSVIFTAPTLIAWMLGDSMRWRRAYYANLEERAAQLERDRDAQAQIAAAAERARIARELHDVVAHNVSVMVVQADGAAYAMGADPRRAREALAAISATGRQALTEMRVLLGVLRKPDDGDQAVLAPQPGIGQLDELLGQARAAGLPVRLVVEGEPLPLPSGTALAAYRIIQESLTNTRKHAGSWAIADVTLRYTADALELTITDNGRGAAAPNDGGGHGLTGMRERAAMYGGTVQAAARPDGGFSVTARLPIAPPRESPASPVSPASTANGASPANAASPASPASAATTANAASTANGASPASTA